MGSCQQQGYEYNYLPPLQEVGMYKQEQSYEYNYVLHSVPAAHIQLVVKLVSVVIQ